MRYLCGKTIMKVTEVLRIIEAGANVVVSATSLSLSETRMLARAALRSEANVTVTDADVFTASELYMIASEGKAHVTFSGLKVENS